MSRFNPGIFYHTDGYKPGHVFMLAPDTQYLYGTFIPRTTKRAPKNINKIVSFGQQYTWREIHDIFQESFFSQPINVAKDFINDLSKYTNQEYNGQHILNLHELGYLPMHVKALPEGIETPANVAHMTFVNTKPGFAWLPLNLETIISNIDWVPTTVATYALEYKRTTRKYVMLTDPKNEWLIPYLCHDFSARGLKGINDMVGTGLGFATSFRGSDTMMVIPASRYYYDVDKDDMPINSVLASEHSVSTTKIFTVGEKQMLLDWLDLFKTGILSVVMDTFDITKVVKPLSGGYLYDIAQTVLNRNGKLVIRPDSAPKGRNAVDMICGHDFELTDREKQADYPEFYHKGLIECLWDIFGGHINEQGYKVLNPCIGAIYGDSITLEKQVQIYERLMAKGFAATNIVLGVGSYGLGNITRDTFGWAAKGGWFRIERFYRIVKDKNHTPIDSEYIIEEYDIYKEPITDDGTKTSPKGRVAVFENEFNEIYMKSQCTKEEEEMGLLNTIYLNGKFYNITNFDSIRSKIDILYKGT
jgi:nicotinamide phosphoribosyltransferase